MADSIGAYKQLKLNVSHGRMRTEVTTEATIRSWQKRLRLRHLSDVPFLSTSKLRLLRSSSYFSEGISDVSYPIFLDMLVLVGNLTFLVSES